MARHLAAASRLSRRSGVPENVPAREPQHLTSQNLETGETPEWKRFVPILTPMTAIWSR